MDLIFSQADFGVSSQGVVNKIIRKEQFSLKGMDKKTDEYLLHRKLEQLDEDGIKKMRSKAVEHAHIPLHRRTGRVERCNCG